jgi:ribosomal protein S18 acetylase RimI-like enzyme
MSLMLLPKDLMELAAERFAAAFMHDPIHVFFFPDEVSRFRRLKALYAYLLATRRERCHITSAALEGLAIWETPDDHGSALSVREVLLGLGLPFACGPRAVWRMLEYQLRASKLRMMLAADPYWYLRVVAVAPEHQGKGHASALIRPFLEAADGAGHQVFLETHNLANVRLYERYGFRVVAKEDFWEGSVEHVCMLRLPGG